MREKENVRPESRLLQNLGRSEEGKGGGEV